MCTVDHYLKTFLRVCECTTEILSEMLSCNQRQIVIRSGTMLRCFYFFSSSVNLSERKGTRQQ